jgi:hypothetical protein
MEMSLRWRILTFSELLFFLHHVWKVLEVRRTASDDELPSFVFISGIVPLLLSWRELEVNCVRLLLIVFSFHGIELSLDQNYSILLFYFLFLMGELLLGQSLDGKELVGVNFNFVYVIHSDAFIHLALVIFLLLSSMGISEHLPLCACK